MKKVLSIVAIAAFAATFTSCKKEYTCECEVFGVKSETTAEFSKKKDAEDWCESNSYCTLK